LVVYQLGVAGWREKDLCQLLPTHCRGDVESRITILLNKAKFI
jgi:hypothetical protein